MLFLSCIFVDIVIYVYRIGDIREEIIAGTYDVSKPKGREFALLQLRRRRIALMCKAFTTCQISLRGST